jgi:hypothetical protein
MKFVGVHFDAISDLMMHLTLAADVNSDLGNIVRLLTAIRGSKIQSISHMTEKS